MARIAAKAYTKERCTNLRAALLGAQVISATDIAPYWPGGAENPTRDIRAWINCYAQLARFSARSEARQEFTHGEHSGRSAELIALLANTPRRVRLLVPLNIEDNSDPIEEVVVGYRSWTALRMIAVYARIATRIAIDLEVLETSSAHADLLLEGHAWHERILLTMVWAAMHDDPNGGLPWNHRTTIWPDLPAFLESMSVVDRLSVQHAYADVHGRALTVLSPYLAPEKERDPLGGWHTFFAGYASEHDVAVDTMMDARPFAPFLAQLSLAAHSAREQAEKAKEESDAAKRGA